MDESTQSRIGGVQPISVRSESKRMKWLLLLLTILLLTSVGVITGILLHTSNKYDSLTDQPTTGPADFKTTELQTSAQNMTIDLSSSTQTTTPAEFKKMTLQELAQTMTSDSLTVQTTTGPADFKTTELQTSAQNMTIETMPLDCKELYMNGKRKSGVYTIYPWEKTDPNYRSIQVYCDMDTEGGGWTAIQRRINGEETFNRNWTEYKLGFGTPYGDYWIGNDAIHQLSTGRNSSLRITITPMNGGFVSFKMYHQFYVSGEDQNYRLQVAKPGNGSLGNSLVDYRALYRTTGMQFSTFDVDNDNYPGNCAAYYLGGWWFNACFSAFLNGPWQSDDWVDPWDMEYKSGRLVNGTSMLIKSH